MVHPESKLLHDASRKNWSAAGGPRPLSVRIWPSPTAGPAAVVLLSHGTGGAAEDLDWLARPLNEAGFLIASVDHHGNSYNGGYLVEGFTMVWERPRDISFLLDHVIGAYDVDTARIGSVGFSLGGYTVAALLGARIDADIMRALFQGHVPLPEVPEFPLMIETLRSQYSEDELAEIAQLGSRSLADSRVRAGVLLAPAIGALLEPASLEHVDAPVLVLWGDGDDIAPPDENARTYQRLIPRTQGGSVGANAGHYVFLGDRDDPSQVRTQVADKTVAFFTDNLNR